MTGACEVYVRSARGYGRRLGGYRLSVQGAQVVAGLQDEVDLVGGIAEVTATEEAGVVDDIDPHLVALGHGGDVSLQLIGNRFRSAAGTRAPDDFRWRFVDDLQRVLARPFGR